MPARGPFGITRPFSEQQLEVDFVEGGVEYTIRGPFGVKRILASPNPGATEEEMVKCMVSETTTKFIMGLIENSSSPPDSYEQALEWQKNYCEGVIEGIKTAPGEDSPEVLVEDPQDLVDNLGLDMSTREVRNQMEQAGLEEIPTRGQLVESEIIEQIE